MIGHEQKGMRPVLIEFNAATNLPVILSITTGGEFARRIWFCHACRGSKGKGYRSLRSAANA